MSGLAITQAPSPSLPMRFLVSAPIWGVFAGVWMAVQGDATLVSRWAPATIALVHMFVLGVLGNTMLGALTQFMPVAAGSPFAASRSLPVVHVTFNLGLAVFVAALSWLSRPALLAAGTLLGGSLLAYIVLSAMALLRGRGMRWLRGGIGLALAGLAVTVTLGFLALTVLSGEATIALDRLVDTHAAFGIVGWILVLIAAVGTVTAPMLLGTRAIAPAPLYAWITPVLLGLVVGVVARLAGNATTLAIVVAASALSVAGAALWLQWRAPRRRNPTLGAFWCLGFTALAIAALAMLWPVHPGDVRRPLLIGTLALGIGLPLIVVGMTLEIGGFLAWIHLRRIVPRGRQVPGVGRLLPERDKRWVLVLHVLAALALITVVTLQRGHAWAGLALAVAHAGTLVALSRCLLRVRQQAGHGEAVPAHRDHRA